MIKFNAVIDYFIKDQGQLTTDARYRHRLLVGIIVLCAVILILFDTWFLFSGTGFVAIATNFIVTSPLLALYVILLYQLRRGRGFVIASQMTVFLAYLGVSVGVVLSGGPFLTTSAPLLMIPPVMGFLLLGRQTGAFWTVLIFLTNYSFVLMDIAGVKFPIMMEGDERRTLMILHWSLCVALVIGLVAVYEHLNRILANERDAEKSKFQHMAFHDTLTGLPNRKLFNDTLESSLSRAKRHGFEVGLLLIDLNGFKPINDTYGHDAGDALLIHVANALKNSIRKNDLCARLGGDEFAVIVDNIKMSEMEIVTNKLLKAMAEPVQHKNQELAVTGSIGVALFPFHARDEETLRKIADIAMYEAKQNKMGWSFMSLASEVPSS